MGEYSAFKTLQGWLDEAASQGLTGGMPAVSYTHLDVYKRQPQYSTAADGVNLFSPFRPALLLFFWEHRKRAASQTGCGPLFSFQAIH